jgi:hypothetical protein
MPAAQKDAPDCVRNYKARATENAPAFEFDQRLA